MLSVSTKKKETEKRRRQPGREKAAEKQREFQEKLEEKRTGQEDGTVYLKDTDIQTIMEAVQEEDAGKTTVKDQQQVGANLDLKI